MNRKMDHELLIKEILEVHRSGEKTHVNVKNSKSTTTQEFNLKSI